MGIGRYGDTAVIKNVPVTQCAVSDYSTAEIEGLLSSLQPAAMDQAGQAFTNAGQVLAIVAEGLIQHARRLNENWSGRAAQAALASFQPLHQSAMQLAQASAQTGSVLSWLADPILPYYQSYRAPDNGIVGTVETLVGHNPQQIAAQQHLARLNDRLTQANGGLPDTASVNLPLAGSPGGVSNPPVRPGSGGTGGGTAGSGTGGRGSGGGGPVSHGGGGGGPVSHGGGGGGGGGVTGGAGGGGGSGGGGTAPRPVPPPVGGGVGALPPGSGAGTGMGMGGMLPIVGGSMAAGAVGLGGAGALRAAAADGAGLGMNAEETAAVGPDGMVGSGSGTAADEGTAAAGADEASPGEGAGGGRERERMRQSWMGEDPSTWDEAAGTAPPTVGT